jgi:predicted ATPase
MNCVRRAERANNPLCTLGAYQAVGRTAYFLGEFHRVHQAFAHSLASYDPSQLHTLSQFLALADPKVEGDALAAWTLWLLGYPTQAQNRNQAALTLAQNLQHPFSQITSLYYAARLHHLFGEPQITAQLAERGCALATEQSIPMFGAMTTILHGWALAAQGQEDEGISLIEEGLTVYRATQARLFLPYYLSLLAQAYGYDGRPAQGLAFLDEAIELAQQTGETHYDAELYRLEGGIVDANFAHQSNLVRKRSTRKKQRIDNDALLENCDAVHAPY